jgi:hypothetical protein
LGAAFTSAYPNAVATGRWAAKFCRHSSWVQRLPEPRSSGGQHNLAESKLTIPDHERLPKHRSTVPADNIFRQNLNRLGWFGPAIATASIGEVFGHAKSSPDCPAKSAGGTHGLHGWYPGTATD